MTAIPDSYFPLLAQIESGGNPYAKAATSSASGLYQMLRSIWIGEGGAWGTDINKAFGGLRPLPNEQTTRIKTFTAKNVAYLVHCCIPINSATLYAAHFLGCATAARVLAATDDARADILAGKAATVANRSVLERKTVGQFKDWLFRKTKVTP